MCRFHLGMQCVDGSAAVCVCYRCYREFSYCTLQSNAMLFTFCAEDRHPTRLWRVHVRLEKVKMLQRSCTSFVKFLHVLDDYRIMEQNTGVQQLRPNLKSNEIERIDREKV